MLITTLFTKVRQKVANSCGSRGQNGGRRPRRPYLSVRKYGVNVSIY